MTSEWDRKYRARQVAAAHRLAKALEGDVVFKEGREPLVERTFVLPSKDKNSKYGNGTFVDARGYQDSAHIDIKSLPMGIAERVLQFLIDEFVVERQRRLNS